MIFQRMTWFNNVYAFGVQSIVLKNFHVPAKQKVHLPSTMTHQIRGGCSASRGGTKEFLLHEISPRGEECINNRVTVVGTGAVGMACAMSLLTQNVSSDVVLISRSHDKLKGETLDLLHGSLFVSNPRITYSTDYCVTAGSKVCIITAGAKQLVGESRLNLVERNAEVMTKIIPQLVKYSPDTVLLMVSNPVDIMTYVAWKLSGLPRSRVVGTGTNVDSARFRHYIGRRLGVAPTSVHAMIIGEHGDSSVPVWSAVKVSGVPLSDFNPNIGTEYDKEKFSDLHKKVVNAARRLVKYKGNTSWAIGLSSTAITRSILKNVRKVHPVSVYAKGYHCIQEDVFLSLPAVLGRNGVSHVVKECLSDEERCKLQQSARIVYRAQKKLKMCDT